MLLQDSRFSRLQNVAQKEFQQVALTLAGVAQDEDAGGGLVLSPSVQIHNDVGAIAIPADIESSGIGLTGVVEGVEVGHRTGGEDPLILALEGVVPHRVGGQKAVLLAQEELICPQLAPHQLRSHLLPEPPQALRISGGQVDVDRTVYERLPVLPHGGDELCHVLEVALGGDGLFHAVGAAAGHAVLVLRVVEDAVLLRGGHLPGVDAQGDTALFPQVAEQGQLLCGGWVAAQGQGAVVHAAADVVVGVELDRCGSDEVKEPSGKNL